MDIRNCPVCNGPASVSAFEATDKTSPVFGETWYFVRCEVDPYMHSFAMPGKTPEIAVEKWNTRAIEDNLQQEIARLRQILSKLEWENVANFPPTPDGGEYHTPNGSYSFSQSKEIEIIVPFEAGFAVLTGCVYRKDFGERETGYFHGEKRWIPFGWRYGIGADDLAEVRANGNLN